MKLPSIKNKITAPDMARRLLLSYLVAVTVEFFLLPEEMRNLTGLEGLREMSLLRVLWITACFSGFFTGISCYFRTKMLERWAFLPVFGLLSYGAVVSSDGDAFLGLCLLILAAMVISRKILVNTLPFLASTRAFLCLIPAQCECPPIGCSLLL